MSSCVILRCCVAMVLSEWAGTSVVYEELETHPAAVCKDAQYREGEGYKETIVAVAGREGVLLMAESSISEGGGEGGVERGKD